MVIGGEVGGDVSVPSGSVVLSDTAVVNGNLRIAGGSVQRGSSGATVRGSVSQENNPRFPGVPPIPVLPRIPFIGPRLFGGGFDFLRGCSPALALRRSARCW